MANYTLNQPLPGGGTISGMNSVIPTAASGYSLSGPTQGSAPGPAAPVGTTSGARTLYDPTAGNSLAGSLEGQFEQSPNYTDILSRYNQAQGYTQSAGANMQGALKLKYGADIQNQENVNQNTLTGLADTQRGFAQNSAMLAFQQKQADYRIKTLTDSMNQALMQNNSATAAAMSDLITKEQDAITNARTNFLDNYFKTQNEARSEASFQTPEQQEVVKLADTYPDSGILPTDTLAQAQAKVQGSPMYQRTLASTAAGTQAALASAEASRASAGLSAAQAAQTKTLTNLINGGGGNSAQADDTAVQALLANQKDPTQGMTLAQLENVYSNFPGGAGGAIVQRILAKAAAQGYNAAGSEIGYNAAATNAKNLSSGGFTGLTTGATNTFGNFLGGAFNTNPLTYTAPNRSLNSLANPTKGQTTTLNGKLYSFDGTNWNAIGNSTQ